MADDRDARIAQLEAELQHARENEAAAVERAAQAEAALADTLDQQAATAEVLRAVASSSTVLDQMLDTIVATAARLCGASGGGIWIADGDEMRPPARYGTFGSPENLAALPRDARVKLTRESTAGRAILENAIFHSPDIMNDPEFPLGRVLSRAASQRTTLAVPLVGERGVVGAFSLGRPEVQPFSAREIELVQTFADQAVIAIENARLFEELDQRNARLGESLEQQTATSDILRVIASSPKDLHGVLDALVTSAARLCSADLAVVQRVDGDRVVRLAATSADRLLENYPVAGTVTERAVAEARSIHIHGTAEEQLAQFPESPGPRLGMGAQLNTPLLRSGAVVGVLAMARHASTPFSDTEIALLETFADQAVIAIENVRLFEELESANRQLVEAS